MADQRLLDAVFGVDSIGDTPADRAQTSKIIFVRSLDQIAFDSHKATGRRLTAGEALDAYGWDVLAEVGAEGAALICAGPRAAGNALRARREALNLGSKHVASRAAVDVKLVERAERTDPRVPIRVYERIGRVLGLDERFISVHPNPSGNDALAVRLRILSVDDIARMTPTVVTGLGEAAWVASVQARLERTLGLAGRIREFSPSYQYGEPGYPAYYQGYFLAGQAREILGFGNGPLPVSLREICEDDLGLPLIQMELGEQIAGATIQVTTGYTDTSEGDTEHLVRAIVINLSGRNRNTFVRRSTLAHELGHLLYDPPSRLNQLRVDDYEEVEKNADQVVDFVEQRANAFGVEFIAPQTAVRDVYLSSVQEGVDRVIDSFGISFTAARYQIWNALDRGTSFEELKASCVQPSVEWQASESYATDFHPIPSIPLSRAGRFSAVVVRSAIESVISWDTAAEYLISTPEEVKAVADAIIDLFPKVKE